MFGLLLGTLQRFRDDEKLKVEKVGVTRVESVGHRRGAGTKQCVVNECCK